MRYTNIGRGLEKLVLPIYLASFITYSGFVVGQRINECINSVSSITDYSKTMHPHYKAFDRDEDGKIDEIKEYNKFAGMRVAAPGPVFTYRKGTEDFQQLLERYFLNYKKGEEEK